MHFYHQSLVLSSHLLAARLACFWKACFLHRAVIGINRETRQRSVTAYQTDLVASAHGFFFYYYRSLLFNAIHVLEKYDDIGSKSGHGANGEREGMDPNLAMLEKEHEEITKVQFRCSLFYYAIHLMSDHPDVQFYFYTVTMMSYRLTLKKGTGVVTYRALLNQPTFIGMAMPQSCCQQLTTIVVCSWVLGSSSACVLGLTCELLDRRAAAGAMPPAQTYCVLHIPETARACMRKIRSGCFRRCIIILRRIY